MTGCQANIFQNGDLDFDGSPYWPEWPTSLHPNKYPGSFFESFPSTKGRAYPQYFFQTNQEATLGFPEFEGPVLNNPCSSYA